MYRVCCKEGAEVWGFIRGKVVCVFGWGAESPWRVQCTGQDVHGDPGAHDGRSTGVSELLSACMWVGLSCFAPSLCASLASCSSSSRTILLLLSSTLNLVTQVCQQRVHTCTYSPCTTNSAPAPPSLLTRLLQSAPCSSPPGHHQHCSPPQSVGNFCCLLSAA